MNFKLTIDDTLADGLQALAAAQGISIEEAVNNILYAGLKRFESLTGQAPILNLGSLHSLPPSVEQIQRMCSPIVAIGPIPILELIVIPIS